MPKHHDTQNKLKTNNHIHHPAPNQRVNSFLELPGIGTKRQGWRVSAARTWMCYQRGPMEGNSRKLRSNPKGYSPATNYKKRFHQFCAFQKWFVPPGTGIENRHGCHAHSAERSERTKSLSAANVTPIERSERNTQAQAQQPNLYKPNSPNIRQIPITLRIINTITNNKLIFNFKANKICLNVYFTTAGLIK